MQTTFITIFLAGLAFIVVSWLLGDIFGGDVSHADASASADAHDTHTISIFSPRIIAIFAVGFGAAGYLFNTQYNNQLGAILAGVGTGVVFAGLFLFGMHLLHSQQASSNIEIETSIGHVGVITTDFTKDGVGEVGLTVSGQYITYLCQGKEPYAKGTKVVIKGKQGPYLFVEKSE